VLGKHRGVQILSELHPFAHVEEVGEGGGLGVLKSQQAPARCGEGVSALLGEWGG
jgi:hypothetical protein